MPTVADVMHRFFVMAAPEEPLSAAHQTMRLARLRHLLVGDGDRLLGIASYRDVVEALLREATHWLPRPEPGPTDLLSLQAGTLASVMAPLPVVVRPSTPISEAADHLCRYHYGCLPVVADEAPDEALQVIGLLTETDVLRAAFANGWMPNPRRRARPKTRS